jgi:hypothetical protein
MPVAHGGSERGVGGSCVLFEDVDGAVGSGAGAQGLAEGGGAGGVAVVL